MYYSCFLTLNGRVSLFRSSLSAFESSLQVQAAFESSSFLDKKLDSGRKGSKAHLKKICIVEKKLTQRAQPPMPSSPDYGFRLAMSNAGKDIMHDNHSIYFKPYSNVLVMF